jgi:hypothetical protein
MSAAPDTATRAAWTDAAAELAEIFGTAAFELRFSLGGQAAVRVLAVHGTVAPRHAEPPDPAAPWSAGARCGTAAGWLLAREPPSDDERAAAILQRAVERHSALYLQRLVAQRSVMTADLLERLTHRLRTDVSTLQAVTEGALAGVFEPDELEEIPAEVRSVSAEAQRRLSTAREVMNALRPAAPPRPEPLVDTLRAAGAAVATAVDDERPMVLLAGWDACARLVADAIACDTRLGGVVAVAPHPDGWLVTTGDAGADADPLPWTEQAVGALAPAGLIAAAAGGSAVAARAHGGGLHLALAVPAAPSG